MISIDNEKIQRVTNAKLIDVILDHRSSLLFIILMFVCILILNLNNSSYTIQVKIQVLFSHKTYCLYSKKKTVVLMI